MQALLKAPESAGFCSGVILKENLVLTSAQCTKKYKSFQVAVGELTKHRIILLLILLKRQKNNSHYNKD